MGKTRAISDNVRSKNAPADAGAEAAKTALQEAVPLWLRGNMLDGPLNLVGTEASGTSVHMARSPVDNGLDTLHIGLPGTVGTSVGMRNLNTEGHALTTKITLRHSLHLPSA